MLLVCRTPTGYFSQKTDETMLETAIQGKSAWMPDQGTFALEEECSAPVVDWPADLMIMWLESKFVSMK